MTPYGHNKIIIIIIILILDYGGPMSEVVNKWEVL